ncbi:hypothetical protein A4H97_12215 [Niastella yeongjuensis]|uniref:Uncharacterized protein n=1 Tax=Niastella yeongjuensis TaxID=354355 RepID=A0A1V9E9X2_9BACT|nr:hypothetical protein [Niastella yeongjuensis]OQP42910.1 hypothetical protein A4H97_12215 [Niastella yeongjuensis]SEO59111.1 hypothetical protein SAMN05660816_03110 [Niastella yeongjuensis]
MFKLSGSDILKQLKFDLIGKDSYRGITFTYSWMANQFGHFGLGFIPTLLLYAGLNKLQMPAAQLWAAVIISGTWLCFETYNFLGPLLKFKSSKKVKLNADNGYTFSPAWGNVTFDTLTDLCFFWLGAFSASLTLAPTQTAWLVFGILIIALLYPCRYWYTTKIYLQAAQYPAQFRLSQWSFAIPDLYKSIVESYLQAEMGGQHLFILGSEKSGKTSLGIGIATELSIKHHSCYYTTAMKLFNLFFDPPGKKYPNCLWTWQNASVWVIDDINPGPPIKETIINMTTFKGILDNYTLNKENRRMIREKNIIWVMGSETPDSELYKTWLQMLAEFGVASQNIKTIYLGTP